MLPECVQNLGQQEVLEARGDWRRCGLATSHGSVCVSRCAQAQLASCTREVIGGTAWTTRFKV
jgi:hypothetical protein